MRVRIWQLLLLGFGAHLFLIGFAGFSALRRATESYSGTTALYTREVQTERLLGDLRSDILLSAIEARDNLLIPSQGSDDRRNRIAGLKRSSQSTLDGLVSVIPTEYSGRLQTLTHQVNAYWHVLLSIPVLPTDGKFLIDEVLPKRQVVLSLAAEIEKLTRDSLRQHRNEIDARQAGLPDYVAEAIGGTLLIGIFVAAASLFGIARTPDLKEAMRTETGMFFAAVLRGNRPVGDLLEGKYTFLNETLAKYYGIEDVKGPEFRRVELKTDQRSGILTQASVLTVTSYPNRTSVVLRGKYLLENVFGAAPPPPPPDVPKLDEETMGVAKSLRQQMEQHRSDPACASCHSKMDVLGFGMENYDAIGRWRTTDGKFAIDSTGSFPNGKSFAGPAEMKALLRANMPEFARTIASKVLTYALGRGIEPFDRRTVKEIVKETASDDYRFQSLILAVMHSPAFQQRRGEAMQPLTKTKGIQEIASK